MNGVFLRISGQDVTQYLDIQNYAMSSEDVYKTWTDGNWTDHRVIVRQRIKGKVKAGFASEADYASFLNLLRIAKNAQGAYSVNAYVLNTGTTESFTAYIDTDGAGKWDLVNGRQWLVVTLTITGR